MGNLSPDERKALFERIQAIDAEAIALSRQAAFDGIKDWRAWDKLQKERSELEKKLWGKKPPDV